MVAPVSVVIPTHFRNESLRKAIESVLNQDYPEIETLVVDDSGEDHAEPVVSSFDNIRYLSNERNMGVQFSREWGLDESTGKYIQFLDDDDWLHETKISRQVELLEELDDVGVVYCGIARENGRRILPDPAVRGDVLEHALSFRMAPCMPPTMLIDTDVLEQIPPLTELTGDDYALKIELARVTQFDFVSQPLYYRGLSGDNLGTTTWAVENRRRTIEHYRDLYDQFPPRVHRSALAYVYMLEGEVILSEHAWSSAAVVAFAKAAYYVPGFKPAFAMSFLASLFGAKGWRLASDFYSHYVLGDTHTGKHI